MNPERGVMTRSTTTIAKEVPLVIADRRRFPRYRLSAPITVRSMGLPEMRGMSIEISEGGMSAAVGVGLKVGDAVELEGHHVALDDLGHALHAGADPELLHVADHVGDHLDCAIFGVAPGTLTGEPLL